MNELQTFLQTFLQAASSMPTSLWSGLLALVGLYWILSLASGLNLDMLDGTAAADEPARRASPARTRERPRVPRVLGR